ncbi:metallophosphoesterase [Marinobacterium sediminicola]|uniref:Serine/threonine protein phosphatase 1 n=1 Tax=Marinobacterium sediminicola TaxID=518898 RepID=A0ABY1RVZ0_9GAMM|nr:metallophosphoesterase [Marinobacterium sediminicola]ULG70505.1 metallophosphoesterase [Marinobacterium sediminicola]SMR69150.1 serine/threonine protein phosphatase 1 [Marinobacterium sediminicola]
MTVVKHVSANVKGRDFIVGDIHGWLKPLQAELDAVCFDPLVDRLFAVGDLINRGPDSAACLELTREPWFFAVRGNHEQILFNWLEDPSSVDVNAWLTYGGRSWLGSGPEHFFSRHQDLRKLAECLSLSMPWVIELSLLDGRKLAISHSTLPDASWLDLQLRLPHEEALRDAILWERPIKVNGFTRTIDGVDLCVHGHVIVENIIRRGNAVYIDTGAALFDSRFRASEVSAHPRITAIQVEDLFRIPQGEFRMPA